MNPTPKQPNRPELNIKVGTVRAAIWPNEVVGRDGRTFQLKKVVLERRYKTSQGEWKSTNSFDLNDIPKAILALRKAYEHLAVKKDSEGDGVEEMPIR